MSGGWSQNKRKLLKKWKFEFVIFCFRVVLWLCELDWIEGNPHSNLRFVFSKRTQRTATSIFCCLSWETRWHCLRGSFGSHQQLIVFQHPTLADLSRLWRWWQENFNKFSAKSKLDRGESFFFLISFIRSPIWESRIYEFTCILSWVNWTRSSSTVRMNEISCDLVSLQKVLVYSYCVSVSIYGHCLHLRRSRTMVVSRRRPTGSSCGRAIKREVQSLRPKVQVWFERKKSWKVSNSSTYADVRDSREPQLRHKNWTRRELDCPTLEKVSQALPSGRRLLFNSSSRKLSEISHVFFENVSHELTHSEERKMKIEIKLLQDSIASCASLSVAQCYYAQTSLINLCCWPWATRLEEKFHISTTLSLLHQLTATTHNFICSFRATVFLRFFDSFSISLFFLLRHILSSSTNGFSSFIHSLLCV